MEAPDKIYLFENPISNELDYRWLSKRSDNEDVEYTRTDTFIEKACEYLGPVFKDLSGYYGGADLLNDFKNYMKKE